MNEDDTQDDKQEDQDTAASDSQQLSHPSMGTPVPTSGVDDSVTNTGMPAVSSISSAVASIQPYVDIGLVAAQTLAPDLGPQAMMATTIAAALVQLVENAANLGQDVSAEDLQAALSADSQAAADDILARQQAIAAGRS